MPEAVKAYVDTSNLYNVLEVQRRILDDYKDDIAKYSTKMMKEKVRECFESIPDQLAKDHKKLELKAGVVDGIVYDKAGVEKLATIPSKEVLIAKLLGSFKAPLSNLAYLLNAIKEKKESESAE